MADDKSTSLINLGDLSKPANTLIKKVSSAIGGVFEPWQIKRVAMAQAEANLITAKSDIEITELHRRAMHRFVEEEANRQENMEEITKKSIPLLEEYSNPDRMDNDWVTNFFDKSRIVSDDEMQAIWARVLAGEANAPGTYSKKTVNLLSDLDKRDAEMFRTLCRYGWLVGGFTPLIFDPQDKIYTQNGLDFEALSHLDSLGLIHFNGISGYSKTGFPKKFSVSYCGVPLNLEVKEEPGTISTGTVIFTKPGLELARISNSPGVEGLVEYVKEQWKAHIPMEKSS